MKKLLSMLLIGAYLCASTIAAYAADTETVSITVTITHSKDIEVGTLAITILPGETKVSDALTVKNIGTGLAETITLSATIPAGWSATYQFAASKPAAGDANWVAAGAISEALAYDETKSLYMKLIAPAPPISEESVDLSLVIQAT
ncbi:MAG: hypothetical protein ISS34_05775 [Candidatus Omnitrophica bacterium]|nr:hypothetical protein [Candidatus Omnitrophota bacterium]